MKGPLEATVSLRYMLWVSEFDMSYMDDKNAKRLVEEYSDMILRIAVMYLRQTDDAEDICQEIFLKLLTGDMKFADHEHERAWVIRAAINACKDRKKLAFYRYWAADEVPEQAVDESGYDDSGLLDEVKRLPKWQRLSLYLYYYEGYATAEIGELLGRSKVSVQKDLSRGRQRLKSILESDMADGMKGGAVNEN